VLAQIREKSSGGTEELTMRIVSLFLISAALCQISTAKPTCAPPALPLQSAAGSAGPRPLRVVLYPFIPGFAAFKNEVKSRFEQGHSDIRLEIVDLSDNYYGPFAAQYVGCAEADVYELDSVFLYDFAVNKKIQELPKEATLPDDALLKNAVAGSMANGKRYGAPHWVCGNFLFFDSSDTKLRGVKTLKELVSAIGPVPAPNRGLAVDLMGKSTLGEFYLNAAFDRYGDLEKAREHVVVYDSALKDDLLAVSKICQVESCRKSDYHQTPFFAEEFAKKHARALVGYSESLTGALAASADPTKCPLVSACRTDNDFDVEEFPLDDKGAHAMSWVDSFALDKKCKDQCAKDAVAFIQFMSQDDTYLLALLPQGAPPTYLLPAKASFYSNADVLKKAHLYPKLRKIIEQAAVPSALSLNEQLRNAGRQLDSDLPQQQ
jgi:thiamine pyridinylase